MSNKIAPAIADVDLTEPYWERRRLGRLEHVHPSLLSLLRGKATECELGETREQGLAPAIGIMTGVIVSTPIWIIIGLLGWLV